MGRIQHTWIYLFYHGVEEAIDSVVETIGVPPGEYAYADKSIGGDTAPRRMVHHQQATI
jgi:hypothetical protein